MDFYLLNRLNSLTVFVNLNCLRKAFFCLFVLVKNGIFYADDGSVECIISLGVQVSRNSADI